MHSGNLKCYKPEFAPFTALHENRNIAEGLLEYSRFLNSFFVVGEKPELPASLHFKNELICLQMVADTEKEYRICEEAVKLDEKNRHELFELVTAVQPGYFLRRTAELGTYYGIFDNGQLVSVAGERMAMNGFTEVSAIVTREGHTGRGYAGKLTSHVCNKLISRGIIPFLHVSEQNTRAIGLYERLGFITRRRISFWEVEN